MPRTAKGASEDEVSQMDVLREASPLLARLVRTGRLVVAGGVYDLATGRVTAVES